MIDRNATPFGNGCEGGEMNTSKLAAVSCLGMLGLTLVGGTLVFLNRDRVAAALDAQAERARATLFRLGEVMSISSALKAEYGLELDAGYVTSTGSRILRITCTDCDLPQETTAEAHARGIAVAARRDRIPALCRRERRRNPGTLQLCSGGTDSGSLGSSSARLSRRSDAAVPSFAPRDPWGSRVGKTDLEHSSVIAR
jgi:hypothetical protein